MAVAILSPHLDDAVLSCWHLLASDHEVCVINVFSGTPAEGEPLAWWDRLTGARDAAWRMRERLMEDRRALALAGRTPTNLRLLDEQYRRREQSLPPLVQVSRGGWMRAFASSRLRRSVGIPITSWSAQRRSSCAPRDSPWRSTPICRTRSSADGPSG